MRPGESLLEMARRHVREGEEHVRRQQRIVAELREAGHPAEIAEQLLAEFRSTLRDHRTHLDRLMAGEGFAAAGDRLP